MLVTIALVAVLTVIPVRDADAALTGPGHHCRPPRDPHHPLRSDHVRPREQQ
jgi:hypothetical protein